MRRRLLLATLLPLVAIAATVSGVAASAANKATTAGVYPTVTGAFGTVPTITFAKGVGAPKTLESKTLVAGHGPVTKKGDLLVANYVGQIWDGKVFDSSFKRKQLAGFPIGVSQVIAGWDDTLVGVHVGSRMLLVIPPKDGYGTSGNSSAGITGKDDLVFVVDIVGVYTKSALAPSSASAVTTGTGGITVTGKVGPAPTVKVAKSSKVPATSSETLLARGHGPKVKPGLVVIQYTALSYGGVVEASTWKSGYPYAINLLSTTTPFNKLIGLPIGSRVLFRLNESGTGIALVLDLVAEPSDPQH